MIIAKSVAPYGLLWPPMGPVRPIAASSAAIAAHPGGEQPGLLEPGATPADAGLTPPAPRVDRSSAASGALVVIATETAAWRWTRTSVRGRERANQARGAARRSVAVAGDRNRAGPAGA